MPTRDRKRREKRRSYDALRRQNNPGISASNFQKRYKTKSQKLAIFSSNWRGTNPEKRAQSRQRWYNSNREKSVAASRNFTRALHQRYAKNALRRNMWRNAAYKQRLLLERQIIRQRYRINLVLDSQYYRNAKSLLDTGTVVAEQRFAEAARRAMCKNDKNLRSNDIVVQMTSKTLVLKALYVRTQLMHRLKRTIAKYKNQCTAILMNGRKNSDPSLKDLCGESEHRTSREPFFKEFAYHLPMNLIEQSDDDKSGSDTEKNNVQFECDAEINEDLPSDCTKTKTWPCSSIRCSLPPDSAMRFRNLLSEHEKTTNYRKLCSVLDLCSAPKEGLEKRGHPKECLPHVCRSNLKFLRQLAVHYRTVSTLVRRLYEVRQCDAELHKLDVALIKGDVNTLKSVEKQISENPLSTVSLAANVDKTTPEEKIRVLKRCKEFTGAIAEKPMFECASCNMLHYRSGVVEVFIECNADENTKIYVGNKNRKGAQQNFHQLWADLIVYVNIKSNTGDQNWFICHKCYKHLKEGRQHASISAFNAMNLDAIPEEIKQLNKYELLLLQKAKAFQTVLRLGTVGSKLPVSDRVQAIKGQVLHYPLPISETLNALPQKDEMPADHQFHIIVNGIPTKSRVIWKSLVDVGQVIKAFTWLRKYNREYKTVRAQWCPLREDKLIIEGDDAAPSEEVIDACQRVSNCPMIRKVSELERAEIVENYTVYPMQKIIPQESDLQLYQMERVGAERIHNREANLEIWCFPHLYPTGRNGRGEQRTQPVSNPDWIKSRLLNADPRFRHDPQYIFYLLHQYYIRATASAVYQSLRNTKQFDCSTVGEFVKQVETRSEEIDPNLNTTFENIRGTPEYFSSIKRDLLCMVRELGSPTWFVTLSAAEYNWEDMTNLLLEVNKNVDGIAQMRNGERCAMDPVNVTRHFHHRFLALFKKVICCEGGGPLGTIVDWFWRVEYQSRGAPHIHMILWVKDAPRMGINSSEAIAAFIEKHVTCRLPDAMIETDLHQIVMRYQFHRVCNNYCRPDKRKKCRFGFPRIATNVFILNDATATCRKRCKGMTGSRFYELPRKECEEYINDYNEEIATLWNANTDVQYIGYESTAIVNYVVSYITKKEQSALSELWDEIDRSKSLSKRLFHFTIKKITSRECGTYEAVDTLLGRHLYQKSREVQYINARKPHARPRILKPLRKLKEMENADSNEKYENDWFNTFYPDRSDALENMCLYDVRQKYDRVAGEMSDCELAFKTAGGYLKLRSKPRLISHPIFKPKEPDEDYWYMLLLLFKPFRNETAELLDETGKCWSIFASELLRNEQMAAHHMKLQKHVERIEANEQTEKGHCTADNGGGNDILDNDEDAAVADPLGAPMEAAEAMAEFAAGIRVNDAAAGNYERNLKNMNVDQQRIFNSITQHIMKNSNEQMCMFVGGPGGTGKSFLIETLKMWAHNFYKSPISATAIVAPTGLAAYNVNGMTMHRFLQLPIQHGATARFKELSPTVCKELKTTMQHIKILVIDEISMVSNLMLTYTHLRLRQIYNRPFDFFGGLHVIVMGDFAQLMPVAAGPIFESLTSKEVKNKIGSLPCSINLWSFLFTRYDELTISMRQKDDPAYGTLLNRLRFGSLNADDVKTLQSRLIPMPGKGDYHDSRLENLETLAKHYLALRSSGKETVCLLPTSAMVTEFNNYLISKEQNQIYECIAEDAFEFPSRFKNIKEAKEMLRKREGNITETAGIETVLRLAIGCRVMLRRNIHVEMGLVNGVIGCVDRIVLCENRVEFINVTFDNGNRQAQLSRSMVKFQLNKLVTVERKQFPLVLSYAMTIHKAQGLSLDSVIADVGNSIFQEGMTYVALSRVRTLAGLHLINFDPSRARANEKCVRELNRLREIVDSPLSPLEIPKKGLPWKADRKWCNSVAEKLSKPKNKQENCDGKAVENSRPAKKVYDNWTTSKKVNRKNLYIALSVTKRDMISDRRNKRNSESIVEHTSPQSQQHIQWPKFDNQRMYVCYANSALQCLLVVSAFETACIAFENPASNLEKAMHDLYTEYKQRKLAGTRSIFTGKVRRFVGAPFNTAQQQCAFDFMRQLLIKLMQIDIFFFTSRTTHRCTNCSTTDFGVRENQQQIFLNVAVRKNVTFNQMLHSWQPVQGVSCPTCGSAQNVESIDEIKTTRNYLFLYFPRHSGVAGDTPFNLPIEGFDCDQVRIGPFIFKAISAILHYGQTSTSGHYIAHVRTQNYGWLKCDDSVISRMPSLPQNLQNVSVMILKKYDGVYSRIPIIQIPVIRNIKKIEKLKTKI